MQCFATGNVFCYNLLFLLLLAAVCLIAKPSTTQMNAILNVIFDPASVPSLRYWVQTVNGDTDLAQLVERVPFKLMAVGSSPTVGIFFFVLVFF